MSDEHDKAIEKIAKLLRLAEGNGTTPHESANAAAAAQALMDRLKVTRAAVDTHVEDEDIAFHGREPLIKSTKLVAWKSDLADRIAKINQCRVLACSGFRGVKDSANVSLVGRASDVEVVRHLYAYLSKEIDRLAREAVARESFCRRGEGRVWGSNFRFGAILTVTNRLREASDRAQREAQERLAREQNAEVASRALVIVTDHDKRVQVYVDNRWSGTYRVATPTVDSHGHLAGQRAGHNIPLHDAMPEGSAAKPLAAAKED